VEFLKLACLVSMLALHDAPALDAEEEQGLPRAMICPITTRFMRDPAVTSEGQSYERRAILNWLKYKDTDPVTMQKCSKRVYENAGLRWLIREHLDIKTPYEVDTEAQAFQQTILDTDTDWQSYFYYELFSEEVSEPTDQSAQAAPPAPRFLGFGSVAELLGASPAQPAHCPTSPVSQQSALPASSPTPPAPRASSPP